jgi:hypothetical protein
VRDHDEAAVVAGMHALGYLPGDPSDWDGALLLEYMRRVSWWLRSDGPLRLGPDDLWRSTEVLREDGGREHMAQLRQMTVPAEALLLRRMEGLLFQTASTLRAQANWGALIEELIEGGAPVSPLGAEHTQGLAARGVAA